MGNGGTKNGLFIDEKDKVLSLRQEKLIKALKSTKNQKKISHIYIKAYIYLKAQNCEMFKYSRKLQSTIFSSAIF